MEGELCNVYLRVARVADVLYVDLADGAGHVVEIRPGAWSIATGSPVLFRRPKNMGALPLPASPRQGDLSVLLNERSEGGVLNIRTREERILIVGWLLGTLIHDKPYPALTLTGEQASGKSTAESTLRYQIDPFGPDGRGLVRPPRDPNDLGAIAFNSHILALENVSYLSQDYSDALAAIATGTNFAARELYTNFEQASIYVRRPIIMNGIADFVTKGDLMSRAIAVTLEPIPDDERAFEGDLWSRIDEARPYVMAGLFDAAACALAELPNTTLESKPRMADFARWVKAAEPALPWEPGAFEAAYDANRQEARSIILDGDPLCDAVISFVAQQISWTGAPSVLHGLMKSRIEEFDDNGKRLLPKWFPKTPNSLGIQLRRVADALRTEINIEFPRSDGRRLITLEARKQ